MLAHQLKQSKEKLKQDKDLFFFPINLEQLSLETETTVMAFRSVVSNFTYFIFQSRSKRLV